MSDHKIAVDNGTPYRLGVDIVLGPRHVCGPRNSVVQHLLGNPVTPSDLLTDTSEWGWWSASDPLEHRPPELWVDKLHDPVGGDW